MAYGSVLTDVVQSSTAGTPPQFNDGNGTQIGTLCRAWVNFNGTTSPGTIRASFNVSSVTRNGTGDYTVNFTNAMPDVNYAMVTTSEDYIVAGHSSYATGSVRFVLRQANTGTAVNISICPVAVFR